MRPLFGLGKKKPIIIGIHGLNNKPRRKCLKRWWYKSLKEGLISHHQFKKGFKFRMVYWADILYDKPLNPQIQNENSAYFVDEPYMTASSIKTPADHSLFQQLLFSLNKLKEYAFLSKFGLARFRLPFDFVLGLSFKDLDSYYNEKDTAADKMHSDQVKNIIRDRLAKVLIKYRKRKILLIAHSMGSIIAYDVLYELQQTNTKVHTFITMGSPLGLPMIRQKFNEEFGLENEPTVGDKTPDNIASWYNFTDIDDQLAAHHNLDEVFSNNSRAVAPIDQLVSNDYKNWKTANAHKSFGYLRTPELSQKVFDFLTLSKKTWLQTLKHALKRK